VHYQGHFSYQVINLREPAWPKSFFLRNCYVKWLSGSHFLREFSTYMIKVIFVRFQVLTAASREFRFVFWDVLPCKIIVDRRYFTRQYIPEDKSELQGHISYGTFHLHDRSLCSYGFINLHDRAVIVHKSVLNLHNRIHISYGVPTRMTGVTVPMELVT
jgi:hypothetical protein